MTALRSGPALIRTVVLESSPVRRAVFLGLLPSDQFDLRFPIDDQNWSSAFEGFATQVVLAWQEDPARFRATCTRVRGHPEAMDLPLVIVTRRRAGVDRAQATEAGADGLVLLPAGAPDARAEIEAAIASRRSAPVPRPRSDPTVPAQKPAVLNPTAAAAARAAQATSSGDWAAFRDQVGRLHATLDRATHYEVLGILRTAPPQEITLAFHNAAIAFHPDRFTRLGEPDLRRMIYDIFKRMSKAYTVLADPRQRAAYDQSLSGAAPAAGEPPSSHPERARTPQGRKFLDMAERSIQQRKYRAARLQLAIAMQMEPGNQLLQQMIRDVDRRIAENPDSD